MPTQKRGLITSVRYQSEEGWTVASMDDGTTVVGDMPDCEVGRTLKVKGKWKNHKKYGRQLQVEKYYTCQPSSEDGLKKYLESVDGIGPSYAERIAEQVDVAKVESDPDAFYEVEDVPEGKLEQVAETWMEDEKKRNALIDIQEWGISSKMAEKVWSRWGEDSAEMLSENPYRLCRDVPGFGFKKSDSIAMKNGFDRDCAQRIQEGILHTLNEEGCKNGHIGLPSGELISRASDTLSVPEERIADEMRNIHRLREDKGLCYRVSDLSDERKVASELVEISHTSGVGIDPSGADIDENLTEKQREAVLSAAQGGSITVLTGPPGSGKSYCLRALTDAIEAHKNEQDDEGGRINVHLAAPTGRAADRMYEATGKEAKTIHRLLDAKPDESGNMGFQKRPDSIIGLVVVDETSMVDTNLMARLLECIHPSSSVMFVGDPDQLPSIGPGYVLEDIMSAEIGTHIHLDEIHRQAEGSGIIEMSQKINNGDVPDLSNQYDDYACVQVCDSEEAKVAVKSTVHRLREKGWDLKEDVQVLAPMYKSACGVEELNDTLQKIANGDSPGQKFGGTTFREGDRVRQTRNDYEKSTMNGDIGKVHAVCKFGDGNDLVVKFPGGRLVGYTESEVSSNLTLSYASTIHAAQGSEYPVVVTVLTSSFHIMLQRTLVYTAISRASEFGVLVAEPKAIERACKNNPPVERHRRLLSRISEVEV